MELNPATSSSGTPEAQRGHCAGVQRLFGISARLFSATPLLEAYSEAAVPSTSKVLMAATVAPQISRSSKVPRTAEPALITSFTIATRFPRSLGRSDEGILYPARKRPLSDGRAKRSE